MTREEAINILNAIKFILNNDQYTDEIEEALNTAIPALQQPEIISCKDCTRRPDTIACGDCKYWICHDRRCGYWNHGVKPLDWCCHAERRTNG